MKLNITGNTTTTHKNEASYLVVDLLAITLRLVQKSLCDKTKGSCLDFSHLNQIDAARLGAEISGWNRKVIKVNVT